MSEGSHGDALRALGRINGLTTELHNAVITNFESRYRSVVDSEPDSARAFAVLLKQEMTSLQLVIDMVSWITSNAAAPEGGDR
ncbi:hypothetical protein [Rhodococcus sp. LB1]|uniref:hypothetical protein n=1 Tax=Rhodococcus sp. LB1 TaxID=1807499 RepID=UPI00077A3949|nr:hypothetical protein [Rhodococcus sp. LB1]KXX59706.1 hypothetical protein AZG88_06715 [Rhodococcus sp. LB1]